jgi:hypothetical protein
MTWWCTSRGYDPKDGALDDRSRAGQASIHRSERGAESDVKALATWFVLMAAGGLLSACGGGSTPTGGLSRESSSHKDNAGCLIGSANCDPGASATCKAAEQTIQEALAKMAKPIVEIAAGPSAITTRQAIAKDRQIIRQVIAQVTAVRATYLTGPNADPNLDANIAALKSYLR